MAAVNITAFLDYTFPTETVTVNAGDTLFLAVSAGQPLTSWYVNSSSGFSSVSPTSASSDGTCTAVIQSSGGTYSIQFLGQYYDYDFFSYIDVGYTVTGTITAASDTTPDQFTFTDISGQNPSTEVTSNTITVSGINAAASVSISGGTFSINGGAYTTSGSVSNGGTVVVKHTTSGSFSTATNTILTIGGVSDTFTSTTRAADVTPNGFTFTDIAGQTPSTVVTSNAITVSGIEAAVSVSVTGGTVSINGGASTTSGSVSNGGTVAAIHTTSGAFSTATNTIVTIGGVSDTFTSTTRAADVTPNAFTFTDIAGQNPNTVVTSNAITVSGIEAAVSVSVTGGTVSINGGASTTSGSVSNGGTVAAIHTTSGAFNTNTDTVVTIGGISDTFTSTTRSPDTAANAFSFTSVSGVALNSTQTSNTVTVTGLEPNYTFTVSSSGSAGALVDAGGSALSGTYATSKSVTSSGSGQIVVSARVAASGSFGTNTSCTVSVGGQSATYTVTTLGADTTPDAFSFTTQSNVNPSTELTSSTITVSGLNTGTSISVTDGTYSIDSTTNFVNTSGSVTNGQVVRLRHTSTSAFNANTVTTLNIGGVTGTFTSTTRSPDTSANAFSFTDATNAFAGTTYTSNTITVGGLEPNYSIAVSCTGGLVDAGTSSLSGTFAASKSVTTSGSGTLVVATSVLSSSSSGGISDSIVTVGGQSDTYRVTTATNNLPNVFTFNTVSPVALSTLQTSNTITVGGLGGASVSVSVLNGQYSKNGSGVWNNPGTNTTAVDNDTFAVRHTSASTNNTNTDTTLFIGGRAGSFRSTTLVGTGAAYGIQILDSSGNIMLDISDNTIKDFGTYSIGSVTANSTITGIPITDNSIALITNNNGDGDSAIAPAIVSLSPSGDTITVSGGQSGFNIGIRVMEF